MNLIPFDADDDPEEIRRWIEELETFLPRFADRPEVRALLDDALAEARALVRRLDGAPCCRG